MQNVVSHIDQRSAADGSGFATHWGCSFSQYSRTAPSSVCEVPRSDLVSFRYLRPRVREGAGLCSNLLGSFTPEYVQGVSAAYEVLSALPG